MATYALIKNGVVANLIVADKAFADSIADQYDAVIQSEGGVGWVSADNVSIAPPAVVIAEPPIVTRVVPSAGVALSTIKIYGDEFTGATDVSIGGIAATSVTVVSDTLITCVTPVSIGTGDQAVIVTTPDGSSAVGTAPGSPQYFRYT